MHLLAAGFVLAVSHSVLACGGVIPLQIRQLQGGSQGHILRRATPDLQMITNQDSITNWTVAQNTRQMQVTDDAFNARDLGRFNHHSDIQVYQGTVIRNLTEHLDDIRIVFSGTDLHLHNHNYKILFGEDDWTVAVETITGIQNGPLAGLDGTYLPPTNKPVQFDLMTIARWEGGWMMEEYLWSDSPLMYRQLEVLPNKPANDLPDLELDQATPLFSASTNANSSTLNKAAMSEADDALNEGNFTIESLHLSPDAEVFGLSDQPMTAQRYVDWLTGMKTAFPDLRLENQPYRHIVGQGDWTATAALLSGTHQGNLTLPAYISGTPIPASGKKFDLLHYTIARWQNGQIVDLRVNWDLFDLASALGIVL